MPFVNKRRLVASTYSTRGLLRICVSDPSGGFSQVLKSPPDAASNDLPDILARGLYQTLRIHSLFFLYSMSVNRVFAMFSASHMAPAYPMTG